MWHEHGRSDLDWQPELQAERDTASDTLGQTCDYLSSVESIASQEFEDLGYVTPETHQVLDEAHRRRHDAIRWMTDIAKRIFEIERQA